jgi:hypothetical protein
MKVLLELGVFGLWLFVLLLGAMFLFCRQVGRRLHGADGALVVGISAAVLGAIAGSTVATYFEIFPMDLLFWLLAGVVADLAVEGRVAPGSTQRAIAGAGPQRPATAR